MENESRLNFTPIAAAVAAALAPGHGVMAQDADDKPTNKGALEEIVVTARKRTESAQDIPIAIQALSKTS